MKVVKCGGCGAPFHEAPEDATVVCAFCGALNEPTVLKRPVPPVGTPSGEFPAVHIVTARELPQAAGAVRQVGLLATVFGLAVTLVVIALAVGVAWFGLRQAAPHQVPPLPFETKWTLANLADLHERGRTPIDVAAPPGGFARFDPVAQLPWALTVARAWMKDATLNRIDADRIRPDGTLDLAGDADAEAVYRFVSPSRLARYWLDADVKARPESEHELWVIARAAASRPCSSSAPVRYRATRPRPRPRCCRCPTYWTRPALGLPRGPCTGDT